MSITIEGPTPFVVDLKKPKKADLSHDEAVMLTDEIRRVSKRLWVLVTEAHDRRAHIALGYQSWDDYCRAELKISPSRSYQLIDQGHVIREIAKAGADVEAIEPPPARIIARVKDRLPEVRKVTKEAVARGTDVDDAIRDLARRPRRLNIIGDGSIEIDEAAVEEETPATDADADDATEQEPVPKQRMVKCPACDGEGKVQQGFAVQIRTWIKSRK